MWEFVLILAAFILLGLLLSLKSHVPERTPYKHMTKAYAAPPNYAPAAHAAHASAAHTVIMQSTPGMPVHVEITSPKGILRQPGTRGSSSTLGNRVTFAPSGKKRLYNGTKYIDRVVQIR
jgi:hypothetical protein